MFVRTWPAWLIAAILVSAAVAVLVPLGLWAAGGNDAEDLGGEPGVLLDALPKPPEEVADWVPPADDPWLGAGSVEAPNAVPGAGQPLDGPPAG